jgi:transposase-like protein
MAKVKMRKVSRYSNEFKITAIRLAGMPGALIHKVLQL